MGFDIALSVADGEDLRPEQLLELQVLVSHVENGLVLVPVHFIEDGVGDHLLKDALLTILVEEELVALFA